MGTQKWHNHCIRVQQFLTPPPHQKKKKKNLHLVHDSAIPVLGTYPRGMKTYIPPKTCTQMFTTTLIRATKTGKEPNVLQRVNLSSVYLYDGLILSNYDTNNNMNEIQRPYGKGMKSASKDYVTV